MRVFIVHAHPEPRSFNSAMTREATHALRAAGHDVDTSDLYAMGFRVRINDDERAAYLALYRERVLGLASAPTITYPKLADYDAHFVLKSRPRSQIDGDGIAVPGASR